MYNTDSFELIFYYFSVPTEFEETSIVEERVAKNTLFGSSVSQTKFVYNSN